MPTMTHAAAKTATYACQAAAGGRRRAAGTANRATIWSRAMDILLLILKKTHLFADLFRLGRRLAEQPLQVARRLRRVSGELIVHVNEDVAPLLDRRTQRGDPRL